MLAVIEIQKNGQTATPLTTLFEDASLAKSAYHTALAAAAVSQAEEHSVILVSEEGSYMFHEKFIHEGEQQCS